MGTCSHVMLEIRGPFPQGTLCPETELGTFFLLPLETCNADVARLPPPRSLASSSPAHLLGSSCAPLPAPFAVIAHVQRPLDAPFAPALPAYHAEDTGFVILKFPLCSPNELVSLALSSLLNICLSHCSFPIAPGPSQLTGPFWVWSPCTEWRPRMQAALSPGGPPRVLSLGEVLFTEAKALGQECSP